MGGAVLQRYLQDNQQKVSCGVLYASITPYMYKNNVFSFILSRPNPLLSLKSLLNPVSTPELLKEEFFSSAFPYSMAREIHSKLDKTFSYAIAYQFLKPYVDPSKIKCPMVVIGAEEDNLY